MTLELLIGLYVFLVGLVVGSYLNVVIHRLPRRQSTVLPRSRCPRCGGLIRAVDNVPLISFLVLRGRCRHCRAPIPWRYPLVEATNGVLYLACWHLWGVSVAALAAAAFCSAMVVLASIDAEHRLLPDAVTLPGLFVGLALQPWLPWSSLVSALAAALGGGALLLAGGWLWQRLRGVEPMGLGDVKMLAMVGAFLGGWGLLGCVVVGSGLGLAYGTLPGVARRSPGTEDPDRGLPFGVFFALGAVVALFWISRTAGPPGGPG